LVQDILSSILQPEEETMTNQTASDGWKRLPSGCDVELQHGIPVQLSSAAGVPGLPEPALSDEVEAYTGLRVSIGEWLPGEASGEVQARTIVTAEQLTEVLNRLALSAAALFFDRYHKPVDRDDVDWDTLEFANDFRRALDYCGLDWKDVERDTCKAHYLETMHNETRRLADTGESPRVVPESD
jgi:hypothetical protein